MESTVRLRVHQAVVGTVSKNEQTTVSVVSNPMVTVESGGQVGACCLALASVCHASVLAVVFVDHVNEAAAV